MQLGSSWLAADQGPPDIIGEVFVPVWSARENAPFPTRRSEYRWIANQLEHWFRGKVLSAGAGFNQEIHLLEYILGNLGYTVNAVDANASSLHMPPHANVTRTLGDITQLPDADNSYDTWVCVSVIEHMADATKALTLREAHRVLAPGGIALLTTDEAEPAYLKELFANAGFLTGAVANFNGAQHLSPRVSVITAQKPL